MRGNNTGFAVSTPLLGISSDCCSRVLADLEDSGCPGQVPVLQKDFQSHQVKKEICLVIKKAFISYEPPNGFFNSLNCFPNSGNTCRLTSTSSEWKAEKTKQKGEGEEMCPIKPVRFNCPCGVKRDKGDIRGQLEVGISDASGAESGGWECPAAI